MTKLESAQTIPELDKLLQEVNPAEIELVYLHSSLEPNRATGKQSSPEEPDLFDIQLACRYLGSEEVADLNADQLEEFLECVGLAAGRNPAYLTWCQRQKQDRERLQQRWEKDKRLDLHKYMRDLLWRAFSETAETERGGPAVFVAPVEERRIIRVWGYLEVAAPLGDHEDGHDSGAISGVVCDGNDPPLCLPFLMARPSWFADEDVLQLKCRFSGVPALLFGCLTPGGGVEVYAGLILLDRYRKTQLYATYHLQQIAFHAKSQLHFEAQHPVGFPHTPLSAADADSRRRSEAYQVAAGNMRSAETLGDLMAAVEQLARVWRVVTPADPSIVSFADLGAAASINGPTLLALALHTLCCLTLEPSPSALLSRLSVALGLSAPKAAGDDEAVGSLLGNSIVLALTDLKEDRCLVLADTGQWFDLKAYPDAILKRLPVQLLFRFLPDCRSPLQKYIPDTWPKYGGDAKIGNPMSCIAFASVGARVRKEIAHPRSGGTIEKGVLLTAAALILMEDRHQRTGMLPEPWINLSKLMQVIVDNPNIRNLVVFGETKHCQKTIGFLEALRDGRQLPPLPTAYFSEELVARFCEQLKGLHILDSDPTKSKGFKTEFDLAWRLKRYVASSYLEQDASGDGNAPYEVGCVLPKAAVSAATGSYKGDHPLLDVGALEARDETVARTFVKTVEAVRFFGEEKHTVDEMGRLYCELMSFRIVVERPAEQQALPGFSEEEEELKKNFDQQWLGINLPADKKDTSFHERMHSTFKDSSGNSVDQVIQTIDKIVRCIREEEVSRRILINIHHAGEDKDSPLGPNTIHYTLEWDKKDDEQGSWKLIAAYIWRSVDVLGGLPYNIYAAARFLCFIVDECNKQLTGSAPLAVGRMMIVALNLHLYQGLDYGIARQLVENAVETGVVR